MSYKGKYLKRKARKRLKTCDLILIILGAFLLVFTAGMTLIFIMTGAVPDTLITCVFAASGGEFGVMGWIKTSKERKLERRYELLDRKYCNKEK